VGPIRERHHRTAYALLTGVLTFVATACGGSQAGNAPDCPIPTSETETANAPASCEDEPGGVGY
jgi:hypothetical protein